MGEDRQALQMAYPQTLRQHVKTSEAKGITVSADPGRAHLPCIAAFYRDTMEAADAAARYRSSSGYFKALRDVLGLIAHLGVARPGDRPVAALLSTVHRRIAQAHLTGTSRRFAGRHPFATGRWMLDAAKYHCRATARGPRLASIRHRWPAIGDEGERSRRRCHDPTRSGRVGSLRAWRGGPRP